MKIPALLLLTAAITLPGLAAQGPDQRHELIQWREALAMIGDVDSLQEIERATKTVADAERDNPILEMRLGLVWARLAALKGDNRRLTNAARTFNAIVDRHPDWPMAWTALAETELADALGPGSAGFGLRRMMGMDPEKGIVRNFVRGTGADSSDTDGVFRLTRRAVERGEQLEQSIAIRTLRSLPRWVILRDAQMAVLAARAEATFGDKDSAATIIENAALRFPRDPMVLRTQAQMRFLVGRTDGPAPWYLGLSIADSAALAHYVRDLELVVPDSILALLPTATGDQRREIVRQFWADQDPDGLPSHDERLAEHYRRIDFARHHYIRRTIQDSIPRYDPDTMPISSFDARGEILLRHGSPEVRTSIGNHGGPDVTVTLKIVGMPPNESWVYRDHGGNERFYHFVRRGKSRDFESVPSVLDILGESEQFKRFRPGQQAMVSGDTTRRAVLVHGGELVSIIAQELLASRQEMSPIYAEMINAGYRAADSMQKLERDIGDSALKIPYSYELGFELEMDGAIEILAVGSDQVGPILQVAFAISAAGLTPRDMPRGVMYPVRMRVAVRDAAGRNVVTIDTVRAFLSSTRLTPSQHLVGQLPIRVQPGEYRVRVSLESDRRGMLSAPVQVRVPGTSGRLTLSDVSIGTRSVPILWRSPTADTAWANPLGRYRNTDQLQLYFEVGGLEQGTRYRTDIAIDRAGSAIGRCEARGDVLTMSFQGEHPGRVAREQRTLALNRLRPDSYLMAVTVATEDGQSETRCRQFTVTRE
jgi:hypothetical protein